MYPEKDLVQINISRIIPAPKWRVIRLLTKVEEFPSYVPCVKEAKLIEKTGHKMKTRWRIEIDKIPITWIEEDNLDLGNNCIYFNSIEGDLEVFRGKWSFFEHPEGTKVEASVYLKTGIPAIRDFADEYIKNILYRSFTSILEALERRLISIKYASYKKGEIQKIAGFGLVWHLYNFNHFERCIRILNPKLNLPSREFLSQLFHITPSFKLCDIKNFKSKTQELTHGCLIVATIIPDMIQKDIWAVYSKVIKACKIAEKYGVGVVALGGFTSLVVEKIGQDISKEVDVPVTTGNSFTSAMALEGIFKACKILDLELSSLKVTIVGGTGDIGSACARALVDKVEQLTITGREKTKLKSLVKELTKRAKTKVILTLDNYSAVKDADIVLACASVSSSFLDINWFKPGSIVCDVGYPKNVSYISEREDILIFSGGLTKSPTLLNFPLDLGLPSSEVIYGAFAEAIILSLERRFESFSGLLRGKIQPENIEEIKELGKKHGFEASDFYWNNKLIDISKIERVKQLIKH